MTTVTVDLLMTIGARKAKRQIVAALAPHFDPGLEAAEITTPLRLAHFLAQAAHECDGFRTLEEYASGAAYEGRKDLGNTAKGDGRRYKGRGIFQLTGRANYRTIGKALNLPLEQTPELAADPRNAVLIALNYWATRRYRGVRLNTYADRDQIDPITRAINGGLNGIDDRKLYLVRAKTALEVK
jgi:putative chitinase